MESPWPLQNHDPGVYLIFVLSKHSLEPISVPRVLGRWGSNSNYLLSFPFPWKTEGKALLFSFQVISKYQYILSYHRTVH